MNVISFRHKQLSCRAGIEVPSGGGNVGVSTGVRLYWRKYFKSVPGMQGSNDQVNYLIAMDYASAKPVHRFILNSGEPAEIRKSHNFYYIAAVRRNKRHDIIVIQPAYKEADQSVPRQSRLSDEWLEQVYQGKIKRKQK
jgi:hypothetical protein